MIADNHWPTDGEWKESVLRTLIRRSAPSTCSVGRGFIVTGETCSSQLDILIYDNAYPVLYRDGDLVFVSPAACRAVIEVKSKLTNTSFRNACNQLCAVSSLLRRSPGGHGAFVGLFAFEATTNSASALQSLAAAAEGDAKHVIDHVVLGPDNFIKWWSMTPQRPFRQYDSWHAYKLPAMAAGYFVHNLLLRLSPYAEYYDESMWFPERSKEQSMPQVYPLRGEGNGEE